MRRTRTTRLARALVPAALIGALLAGCGKPAQPPATPTETPTQPATETPTETVTPDPSPTPSDEDLHFTVDGAGPYELGTTLASLQAANQVTNVGPGDDVCATATSARGTGDWAEIYLYFKDGKLYLVRNRSVSIPSPSGAWLGTTLADLKTIYRQISGEEITRGSSAYFLAGTISGRGILFELDTNKRVKSMFAGETFYLKNAARTGNFC